MFWKKLTLLDHAIGVHFGPLSCWKTHLQSLLNDLSEEKIKQEYCTYAGTLATGTLRVVTTIRLLVADLHQICLKGIYLTFISRDFDYLLM